MTRQDIKEIAKERLRGTRGMCAGVILLTMLACSFGGVLTMGIGFIFMPLFLVGLSGYFLQVYLGEAPGVGEYFSACFVNIGRRIGGILWMALWIFIFCLGSVVIVSFGAAIALPEWLTLPVMLLCYIPGIVKVYSYFLTPFILFDCPNVSAKDAIKLSALMTEGYRVDIFVTQLSFIGWFILSPFTFCILGFFHAYPYYGLTMAGVYQELKKRAVEDGAVTYSMLDGKQPL